MMNYECNLVLQSCSHAVSLQFWENYLELLIYGNFIKWIFRSLVQ